MVRGTNRGRWWARGASAALAAVLLAPLGMSGASAHDGEPHAEEDAEFSALVFSKTAGFRHGSIPAGVAAIEQLGDEHGFAVDHTEDSTAFTTENLANYDVVVWLSTTGDVLDDEQQAAFEAYIQDGGGYAGIHAASDTEYDWPWYGELVGAYFASHPPGTPNADVAVVDGVHPSTAHLPARWNRTDEWYNYRENPRGDVHVLATLDETTYAPGNNAMGGDHPIAWCHDYDGGRSWYTGGGHTNESYSEPEFVQHILGGIRTAAGVEDADCSATVQSSFEQVTLAKGGDTLGEPIALAVLPNGDVLHTARDGRVLYTTADASTRTAATIPVYSHDEDGLQGIAIDPDFEENRWVYLYYAPPLDTPAGDAPENGPPSAYEPFEGHNSLSRFKLAEDGTLDLASEQEILRVAADRGICCHAGGEIDFDAEGNLYLSTGDDTNPFASDGYSPLDDRADRNPAFDGRRTSGNTNDLRGKLIRIDVMDEIADGAEPGPGSTYTVPEGNLFDSEEYDPELVREEIYAMGFRNPFRFAVDQETGWIHLGDYGPDAGAPNADRGPGGQVEFNLIKEPGNFGWPFCHGANDAYNDYDFATGTSGPKFDCENLVNDSPYNTGLTELPPAVPAWLPYDGGSEPQLGTGSESPMGGPTYRYDPELDSPTKWPEYYDGKTFNYEWGRGWIREFVTDDEGNLVDVVPSFEWLDLSWPMNVEFGPDGALYVLDYGQSWFGGDEFSALYRIDYVGQLNPVARIETSATSGPVPLTVEFDASTSTDPDGTELTFEWDFDNDGTADATGATAEHTFTDPGVHTVRLNAIAADGRVGTATVNITAGNTAPTVELEFPEDGSIFAFGDRIPFKVTVTDPEDGEIDCADVVVEYILGHDSHGHPLSRVNGCEGTIATAADEGHGLDANVFGIINVRYADQGGEGGAPSLTGDDEAMLRLRTQQAEFYDEAEGVSVVAKEGAAAGKQVGDIHNGDWIAFDPLNFVNIDGLSLRYSSGGAGGTVEVRQGSVDGHLAATIELASTGGWETWETTDVVDLDAIEGSGPVYFVFTGDETQALFDIDEIRYTGRGAAEGETPDEPVLVPVEKVSIGLYSLIPWVEAEGLPTVLARLAEIGLENIEPYGGNLTPYTAEQFRAMVDEIGLRVPSSHYNTAEDTFDETLAYVETLGQEYVGSGGFAAPGISTYENTLATAETMNRLGQRSVEAGIGKFFGHNHAGEFTTVYEHDGEQMSAWEILVEETNPEYVTFQVDVAWAAHGGIDVPALLEEHGDRIELLHIKDATNLGEPGGPSFTNLGEGDVPLQDILAAAEEHADIAYYVMEYDVAPEGEDFVVTGFEYLTGLDAGEEGSRPVDVVPAAVTFTDEDGTDGDTYTVPWSVGVEYLVDGEVVAPGTYPGSGTVTVTAAALDGFRLEEGATTEWEHTFSTGGGTPTDPVEGAQALSDALEGYIASGDVAGPIAGQLSRALEQAVRHLEAGREAQAVRSMELFLRHLDNPKRPDTLDAAAQEDLRSQVEVIIDLLG